MDWSPLARILLRYIGGALLAKGVLHDAATLADPDLQQVIVIILGMASSAVSEFWYFIAKKRDWKL
jgi:hypothetical protein